MLSLLATIRSKLWLIGAALLAALAAVVRIKTLQHQRDRARYRAEHAEAQLDFRADVAEADAEIETDADSRNQEIADSIESGKPIESLSKPNDDW